MGGLPIQAVVFWAFEAIFKGLNMVCLWAEKKEEGLNSRVGGSVAKVG